MTRLKIQTKIWLILAILMVSIVVNNIASEVVSRLNADRLSKVSVYLIPLSDLGKSCVRKYQDQVGMFEDSVVFGDDDMIEQARKKRLELEKLFEAILADQCLAEEEKKNIAGIYDEYVQYSIAAEYVYGMMIGSDEKNRDEAQRLAPELNDDREKLARRISDMSEHLEGLLNAELASVVNSTRQVNMVLVVMSGLAIVFVLLINIFIVKVSIIRPIDDVCEQLERARDSDEYERRWFRWQRLESLEELVKDVVGEIGESLNGLRAMLNGMRDISVSVDIRRMLVQSEGLVDKAIDKVSGLRDFVNSETDLPVLYNIVDGIKLVLQVMHGEMADKCTVSENYEMVSEIVCFPEEMNQAFTDLIRNAVKSVGKDGLIRISVWEEMGVVNVRIQDNGCGISRAELPHIFDMFDADGKRTDFYDMGLPVAQNTVKDIGGKIEVESEQGKGSVFTVHLPVVSRLSRVEGQKALVKG